MSTVSEDLQSFSQFVELYLRNSSGSETLDDLYTEWRARNPAPADLENDIRAVQASLRDLESGENGRPFDEFAANFRERKGL